MDFRGRDWSKQVDLGIGIIFGVGISQNDDKNVPKTQFPFWNENWKVNLCFSNLCKVISREFILDINDYNPNFPPAQVLASKN